MNHVEKVGLDLKQETNHRMEILRDAIKGIPIGLWYPLIICLSLVAGLIRLALTGIEGYKIAVLVIIMIVIGKRPVGTLSMRAANGSAESFAVIDHELAQISRGARAPRLPESSYPEANSSS